VIDGAAAADSRAACQPHLAGSANSRMANCSGQLSTPTLPPACCPGACRLAWFVYAFTVRLCVPLCLTAMRTADR